MSVVESCTPSESESTFTLLSSDLPSRPVMPSTKFRVGAVQAELIWLDLDGTVDKTIDIIKESAKDGVQVLGFPEVWVPGYPW
jgi:hypothetical protein